MNKFALAVENLTKVYFSPKTKKHNKALNELSETPEKTENSGILKDRFGIAPFSVLNAREGWWQNRKKMWLDLGIKSEIGRDEDLTYNISKGDVGKRIMRAGGSTSVFDPVITELIYRWFSKSDSVFSKLLGSANSEFSDHVWA